MKVRVILPLLLLVGGAAAAGSDLSHAARFAMFMVPKAFTPNPQLEMSAFTEFTSQGRTVTAATPEHPVYFVAQNQGYQPMGYAVAGDHPPAGAELERFLYQALAGQGYLPANDTAHPPALALIFYWGVHYTIDLEMAGLFPELNEQYLLERATLVGGKRYAHDLSLQLAFGTSLVDRSVYKDFLRNQAAGDLYYVVVSAYDFAALARDERRLLWRTTLTVGAQGVSMRESLPPLILTGGEFFGRAMDETVALRRNVRRGTVTLGPLRVIESDVALPPPGRKK
jgi:hypothetical protein